jgi:L-fucose mutarotase
MLLTKCIHPEILGALGKMGHFSRILIADGGYPVITASPANATKVWLNLMPGRVLVTEVLEALVSTIPLEAVEVMTPPEGMEQPVFDEFRKQLSGGMELGKVEQHAFYRKALESDVALVIATGDTRNYANLLVTMGFVRHPEGKGRY